MFTLCYCPICLLSPAPFKIIRYLWLNYNRWGSCGQQHLLNRHQPVKEQEPMRWLCLCPCHCCASDKFNASIYWFIYVSHLIQISRRLSVQDQDNRFRGVAGIWVTCWWRAGKLKHKITTIINNCFVVCLVWKFEKRGWYESPLNLIQWYSWRSV